MVALLAFFGTLVVWDQYFNFLKADELPDSASVTSLEVMAQRYREQIQPIVKAKCFACHSATEERPFFYHIPLVSHVAQPYVDEKIQRARVNFDVANDFPYRRRSSALEFIFKIQHAVEANAMPPLPYKTLHLGHALSGAERELILRWAAESSVALERSGTQEVRPTIANIPSEELPHVIAKGIIAACPTAAPDDEKARDLCAERLKGFDVLRDAMKEPFLWSRQKYEGDLGFEHTSATFMNPLVWRTVYLSIFSFESDYRVEKIGGLTVIHLPYHFRNKLDPGAFPYPFWHQPKKWDAYQTTVELLLVMKQDRVIGALRSAESDESRPRVHREWDHQFMWRGEDGREEPRYTLYENLFSKENPHVKDLDRSYRKMSEAFRKHNCLACHDPENSAGMRILELFSFPNQALAGRNRILRILQANEMPPLGGIKDEAHRAELLALAKDFQQHANDALRFENENYVIQDEVEAK
ncbi:MAG TPA: heme-binding domain-containing protein [Sorangium sp.]|nr:heme-binding domain-containing protein [Sorangium sp.]